MESRHFQIVKLSVKDETDKGLKGFNAPILRWTSSEIVIDTALCITELVDEIDFLTMARSVLVREKLKFFEFFKKFGIPEFLWSNTFLHVLKGSVHSSMWKIKIFSSLKIR